MARRLADDGDAGTPRRSVADLLREAGIEQDTAPRRRRRFIEPDGEVDADSERGANSERGVERELDSAKGLRSAKGLDSGTGRGSGKRLNSDKELESNEETSGGGSPGVAPRAATASDTDATGQDDPIHPSAEPGTGERVDETESIGSTDDDGTTSSADETNDHAPDAEPNADLDEPSAPEDPAAAVPAKPAKPAREHSGATHWTLAIGEVILAIAIGVGLSFVFRLLWDIAPYAAAVLAPAVICAVVAIVGFSRKKMGLGSIPLSLLLLVLFVTALLVVIPAALVLTAP